MLDMLFELLEFKFRNSEANLWELDTVMSGKQVTELAIEIEEFQIYNSGFSV